MSQIQVNNIKFQLTFSSVEANLITSGDEKEFQEKLQKMIKGFDVRIYYEHVNYRPYCFAITIEVMCSPGRGLNSKLSSYYKKIKLCWNEFIKTK